MNEISSFYGISASMLYNDRVPAHFHAKYNGGEAWIDIAAARVIKGTLPTEQQKLALAWCVIHEDELMQDWELARTAKPLKAIAPLV